MKKTLMSLCTAMMMVLVCSVSANAQDANTSSHTTKTHKMRSKRASITGCVMEKDGKYMMMNKRHPEGVHLMSEEDLKPHVGHKMTMMGKMEKMDMGSMSGDLMKSDDKTMKHGSMGMMDMKVSSMKMISEKCDLAGMDKDKDGKMKH